MDRRDHLPEAVTHQSEALSAMDEIALMRLQVECTEWLTLTKEFRVEVTTPNAVTVWNALITLEIALVVAANARIEEVRLARRGPIGQGRRPATDHDGQELS